MVTFSYIACYETGGRTVTAVELVFGVRTAGAHTWSFTWINGEDVTSSDEPDTLRAEPIPATTV